MKIAVMDIKYSRYLVIIINELMFGLSIFSVSLRLWQKLITDKIHEDWTERKLKLDPTKTLTLVGQISPLEIQFGKM